MTEQSLAEKMQAQITSQLESAFESVVLEKNTYYQANPASIPRTSDIENFISSVALKNSAISGGASLLPGPWGMLAVVPELILVIKNQIELIYDIGAAHGKKDLMTKELVATIFVSGLGTSTGSLLVLHGGKYLVKRASLQVFQKLIVLLGGRITQQALKSTISKWLPGIGAVAMAAWSNYMTRQVGNKALEILTKDIVEEDGILDIQVIEPAATQVTAATVTNSLDYYKLKILTNLAKIDGTVHENEAKFIDELVDRSELTPENKIEILSRLSSQDKDISGIDFITASPDDAIALLVDMTSLAKKDDNLHITEKLYVKQIGKLLGFSETDISEVLNA